MNIILDTAILLWMLDDNHRLSNKSRESIDAHHTFVSAVSLAEIEIKRSIGKLEIPGLFRDIILHSGLDELPYTFKDSKPLSDLPFHHKDPFDRMLIAQAIAQDMAIITSDKIFTKYKVNVIEN